MLRLLFKPVVIRDFVSLRKKCLKPIKLFLFRYLETQISIIETR